MSFFTGVDSLKRPFECALDTLSPDTVRSVLAKQARRGDDIPTSVSVNGVKGARSLLDPLLAQSGSPARLGYPQHVDGSRICSTGVRRATTGVATSAEEKFDSFRDDMETALRASADDYNMYQTAARIVAIVPSIFLPALQGSGMKGKFRVSHTLQRGDLAFCVRAHDTTAMAWLLSDYGWFVQNNSLKMLNLQLLVSLAEVNYILHGLCNNQNADPGGGYQTAWEEFLAAVVGPRHRFLNKGAFEDPQTRLEACSVLVRSYIQPLGMVLACDDFGGHFQFDRLARYDHGSLCSYGRSGTNSSYTGTAKTPTSNVVTLAVDGLVDIVDDGGLLNPVLGQNAGDEVGLVLVEWEGSGMAVRNNVRLAPQNLSESGILPQSLESPSTDNNESSFILHTGPDPSSYIRIQLLSSTTVELVPCSSVVASRLQSLYDVNVSKVYGLWHLFTLQQNVAARPVGEHTINASYRATRSRYGGAFNPLNKYHRKPGQLASTGRGSVEAVFTPIWESAHTSGVVSTILQSSVNYPPSDQSFDVSDVESDASYDPEKNSEDTENVEVSQSEEDSATLLKIQELSDLFENNVLLSNYTLPTVIPEVTADLKKYKIDTPEWKEGQVLSIENVKSWLEETYWIIRKSENVKGDNFELDAYVTICEKLDQTISNERGEFCRSYETWRYLHIINYYIKKMIVAADTSYDPDRLLSEPLRKISEAVEPVEVARLVDMSAVQLYDYVRDLKSKLLNLYNEAKEIQLDLDIRIISNASAKPRAKRVFNSGLGTTITNGPELYMTLLQVNIARLSTIFKYVHNPKPQVELQLQRFTPRDPDLSKRTDGMTQQAISMYEIVFPVLYKLLQEQAEFIFGKYPHWFVRPKSTTEPEHNIVSRIEWMRQYTYIVFNAIIFDTRKIYIFRHKLENKIPFFEILCDFLDTVECYVVDQKRTGIRQQFHTMRLYTLLALRNLAHKIKIYRIFNESRVVRTSVTTEDARIFSALLGLMIPIDDDEKKQDIEVRPDLFFVSVMNNVWRCVDLIDPKNVGSTKDDIVLHRIITTIYVEIDHEYRRLSKYNAYMRDKGVSKSGLLVYTGQTNRYEWQRYEALFIEIESCKEKKGIYGFVKPCKTKWDIHTEAFITTLSTHFVGKSYDEEFLSNIFGVYFQEVSDRFDGYFGSAVVENDASAILRKAYDLKMIMLKTALDKMNPEKGKYKDDDRANLTRPFLIAGDADDFSEVNDIDDIVNAMVVDEDNQEDPNERVFAIHNEEEILDDLAKYCTMLDSFEYFHKIPHWSPFQTGLTLGYNGLWLQGVLAFTKCINELRITSRKYWNWDYNFVNYAKKSLMVLSEYTTPPFSPFFFYDHMMYEKDFYLWRVEKDVRDLLDSYYSEFETMREAIITCEHDKINTLSSYGPRSRPPYYERMLQSLTNTFTKSFTK